MSLGSFCHGVKTWSGMRHTSAILGRPRCAPACETLRSQLLHEPLVTCSCCAARWGRMRTCPWLVGSEVTTCDHAAW